MADLVGAEVGESRVFFRAERLNCFPECVCDIEAYGNSQPDEDDEDEEEEEGIYLFFLFQ